MKRLTLTSFFLLSLAVTSFGQQVTWRQEFVGWRRWPDGTVRPVYQIRQAPRPPDRDLHRWSRQRPTTPLGQVGRFVRNQAWEAAKQHAASARQAYREAARAQRRYGNALRREWEADRRATRAGWINPYSAEARGLRQAATQASMERARAQAAAQLRHQNFARHIYGNTVSTVPTREQWLRTSPVSNQEARRREYARARAELARKLRDGEAERAVAPGGTPTRSEWLSRGGPADRPDRRERPAAPERQSRARESSPSTRDWVAPRPDRRMFEPRPVSGPGWDLVAPRMDRVDRRMFDPRPIGGGKTYGEFTKEKRTYSDTFTKGGNGGAKASSPGRGAGGTRSSREGGRPDRGGREAAPAREAPARETRSYRDDMLDRDRHRP